MFPVLYALHVYANCSKLVTFLNALDRHPLWGCNELSASSANVQSTTWLNVRRNLNRTENMDSAEIINLITLALHWFRETLEMDESCSNLCTSIKHDLQKSPWASYWTTTSLNWAFLTSACIYVGKQGKTPTPTRRLWTWETANMKEEIVKQRQSDACELTSQH